MSLETLAWWAGVKGLDILACGDFTHPAWLAELRRKLRPAGDGLFTLREGGASGPAGNGLSALREGGVAHPAERTVVGAGEALRPAGDGLFTLCEDDASRPAGQASLARARGWSVSRELGAGRGSFWGRR